jgi:hypothetical protein
MRPRWFEVKLFVLLGGSLIWGAACGRALTYYYVHCGLPSWMGVAAAVFVSGATSVTATSRLTRRWE